MKNPVVNNTVTSLDNLLKSGYPYQFKRLCKNKIKSGGNAYNHVYTFLSKHKLKYQVDILEYEIGVFAVKFHMKNHRKHPDRYKMLSNKGDGIVVLKTIVAIMLDILGKENNASFAFVGMPMVNEKTSSTKRYNVYAKFCQRYFSPNNFEHVYDTSKSFYMLLNKKTDTQKIFSGKIKIAESELRADVGFTYPNFARSTN